MLPRPHRSTPASQKHVGQGSIVSWSHCATLPVGLRRFSVLGNAGMIGSYCATLPAWLCRFTASMAGKQWEHIGHPVLWQICQRPQFFQRVSKHYQHVQKDAQGLSRKGQRGQVRRACVTCTIASIKEGPKSRDT